MWVESFTVKEAQRRVAGPPGRARAVCPGPSDGVGPSHVGTRVSLHFYHLPHSLSLNRRRLVVFSVDTFLSFVIIVSLFQQLPVACTFSQTLKCVYSSVLFDDLVR